MRFEKWERTQDYNEKKEQQQFKFNITCYPCVSAHGVTPSLSQPFLIKEQGKLRFCRNAASN